MFAEISCIGSSQDKRYIHKRLISKKRPPKSGGHCEAIVWLYPSQRIDSLTPKLYKNQLHIRCEVWSPGCRPNALSRRRHSGQSRGRHTGCLDRRLIALRCISLSSIRTDLCRSCSGPLKRIRTDSGFASTAPCSRFQVIVWFLGDEYGILSKGVKDCQGARRMCPAICAAWGKNPGTTGRRHHCTCFDDYGLTGEYTSLTTLSDICRVIFFGPPSIKRCWEHGSDEAQIFS